LGRHLEWSEAQLVERMLRREEAAWREFIARHDGLVRNLIRRILDRFPGTSRADTEEVRAAFLHDLLAHDMRKLRRFDNTRGSSLSTWIGMLASHATWDHLRVATRHSRGETQLLRREVTAHVPDPFSNLAAQESARQVEQAVSDLSTKDQTFVHLFYVLGRSPEEISAAMKISVKTVYSKKHKISARLQLLTL
jgi:RNA polymerase sigma-70 factor (ECF subfamily)